jgi:hypothetical protein
MRVVGLLIPFLWASPFLAQQNSDAKLGQSTQGATPHPTETWHYRHVEGIGDGVQLHFEYSPRRDDYVLSDNDRELVGRVLVGPTNYHLRPHEIRFKDLEALVVVHVARNQVKLSERIEFAPLTNATTLTKVYIRIYCEDSDHTVQSVTAYPLFVRVITLSGRVVQTSELTVDMPAHTGSKSN